MYPQNARRGYRQRAQRRRQQAAARQFFPEEEKMDTLKKYSAWIICAIILFVTLCCCLPTAAYVAYRSGWIQNPFVAETQQPAPASPTTPVWDPTCESQSTLMGVTLTPLQEGPAVACIWSGTPVTIVVPVGTFADVDLGGVFVAQGPSQPITGVGRITLRQWISGGNAELCSHLEALNQYLETQPGFGVAAPLNFDCD